MNCVDPKNLEVGRCYALIIDSQMLEVIKILSINTNSVRIQSINLRSYDFGSFEDSGVYCYSYMKGYIEIPEEEYQKFYHLWKMYSTSLMRLQNAFQRKIFKNCLEDE